MRIFILFFLISFVVRAQTFQTVVEVNEQCGQLSFMSNQDAEIAVDRILDQFGLTRTFVIQECPDIENAVAKIVQISPNYKERYIFYDSDFLDKADGSSEGKWGSYFILAHEIGHHLNGHSLDSKGSTPSYELEADYFSGTAMGLLGATLSESKRAIETLITYEKATSTHPAKADRLAEIEKGWKEARKSSTRAPKQELTRKIVKVDAGNNLEVSKKDIKKRNEYLKLVSKAIDNKVQVTPNDYIVAAENYLKAYQYDSNLYWVSAAATNYVAANKLEQALKYNLIIVKKKYKGLEQKDINDINEQIGLIYYHFKQFEDARIFFEMMLLTSEDNADLHTNLANLYLKKQDTIKALEYAEKATKLKLVRYYSFYNLGSALYQLGKYDLSIKYLRKSIELGKKDPKGYSTTHNAFINLSLAYYLYGNSITETAIEQNLYEIDKEESEKKGKEAKEMWKKSIEVLEEGVLYYPEAQGLKNRLNRFKQILKDFI